MEPPTAREVVARLEREGWAFVGCNGRLVVVPGQLGAHLKKGTWSSVRQQAGW